MDRRRRGMIGKSVLAGVGVLALASGCRSMKSEVPPGKPYSTTPGTPPPVGFGSDSHPDTGMSAGLYGPNGLNPGTATPGAGGMGGAPQLGTPGPNPGPSMGPMTPR